jgi:hypothetical protein
MDETETETDNENRRNGEPGMRRPTEQRAESDIAQGNDTESQRHKYS